MIGKEKAILVGPIFSELYWEVGRFVPHIIYKRLKQYNSSDIKFIVMTRPDRFDAYGKYADILVPLIIKNEENYQQDCFRLSKFPDELFSEILKTFYIHFSEKYYILEHILPDISGTMWKNKHQFHKSQMIYNYLPRQKNLELVNKYIPNDKPLVIFAPRFRFGYNRNWIYWQELYDMIYESKLYNNFNFIICGKSPDYVPDSKDRFFDINMISLDYNSSLIGITMETIKRSILTIGSQSAIPNISLLLGVEVLEWGDQKHQHTIEYNPHGTKITFIEDYNYDIKPEIIFAEILKILRK